MVKKPTAVSDSASGLRRTARVRRCGWVAAVVVLFFSALNWLGWATGIQVLTRAYPTWPPVPPWTALLLAALAVAVLAQSGDPSEAGVRLGRGLATAAGVVAVVVLAEYATGRAFGVDQVWFGGAVRALQSTWPGRPSPQTAISVLLLSLVVALTVAERRWVGAVRTLGWFAAMAPPGITVLAFLFDAPNLVKVGQSAGMTAGTALGLLLLGATVILARPERGLLGWLLGRPDRESLFRLAAIIAGFPILVGVSRLALVALGINEHAALAFSAAVGTGVVGMLTFSLTRTEQRERAIVEADRALLQASADSALDPQALLEAVRDPGGRVVDFRYLRVNQATCTYLGLAESDLVGHTQLEDMPNLEGSELHRRYVQCLQDGQPVILDDYAFFNEILDDGRRYDIRATRAGRDLLSLTWRDVTDRSLSEQRLAASEEHFRLLAENASDVIIHARDGRVVWASPSIEQVLGGPPESWVGHQLREAVPADDLSSHQRRMSMLAAGHEVQERFQLESRGGERHWIHAHGRPFYDAQGSPDGFVSALRVIDAEVAAETALAEVNEQFRLLTENSLVASSMTTLDGRVVTANEALCRFLGCDAETLMTKTWRDFTFPEDFPASQRHVEDLVSGRSPSLKLTQRYRREDGKEVWGELLVNLLRDAGGSPTHIIAQIVDITAEVAARAEVEEARRLQAKADELYRRSVDSAAVGMALVGPDGGFREVNDAICEFFGYDAGTLSHKTWQELTAPEFLEADSDNVAAVLAGRIDSYRMNKQYLHADGHLIWGDLSVGCVRNPDGQIEVLIAQVIDITKEVTTRQQLAQSEAQKRALADQLSAEMASAAQYVKSILPEDMHGEVEVTSRYLPAMDLGGDGFHYRWLDEDHLKVYLLDVSGHGIRPALLSASVHNLIRTNSLPMPVMLHPDRVLNRLNSLFQMEDQGDSYFTMFYGIYQPSTRTMTYASAGHPPALALNRDNQSVTAMPLSTPSVPIGTFDDTTYTSDTYIVPAGAQVLIYSDGAFELSAATGNSYLMSNNDFASLCATLAARPDWSLDTLVDNLKSISPHGVFDDDCALVLLTFP